jgi:hypothetical protein
MITYRFDAYPHVLRWYTGMMEITKAIEEMVCTRDSVPAFITNES